VALHGAGPSNSPCVESETCLGQRRYGDFHAGVGGMIARSLVLALGFSSALSVAGEADVVRAEAQRQADGTFRFQVTVRHADTGWEHYANRWEVLGPDGRVLGTRTLYHPHVDEQPFTRSLSGVAIPEEVTRVRLRAGDSVHGNGGEELEVELSPP